jgi:CHAD domain-containing protein
MPPHRVRKHTDVAAELVRVARDDLALALVALDDKAPLDERVHAVRQRIKWIRSTLRVLQGPLGEEARAGRRQAASAARLLSGARDADVAAASARVLSATTAAGDGPGFERLADALDREAVVAHQKRTPLGEVRHRLTAIAESASRYRTDFDGAEVLSRALQRAYHRARRAMRRAANGRATTELHRWRKEIKHLWHLLRLARPLIRHGTGKTADGFDRLVDLLGLDHDHAMLAERLARSPDDRALRQQLAVIAERRSGMENDAFELGVSLFADKPKAFAQRYRLKDGKK